MRLQKHMQMLIAFKRAHLIHGNLLVLRLVTAKPDQLA